MASLSKLIGSRVAPFVTETGLEQGTIEVFSSGVRESPFGTFNTDAMCWRAPGNGILQVEIWGAAGSSGKNCCCGAGVPGNPGAYAKKTICVDSSTYVTGYIGTSCSNNTLCFKGCSEATCIIICSPNGTLTGGLGDINEICMCAEGGVGGHTYCNGSCPPYYCLIQNGFCGNTCANCDMNAGCGIVCNVGTLSGPRRAYGGDINCNSGDITDPKGNWSCATFHACYPCTCGHHDHVAIPPGIISEEGALITYQRGCASNWAANTGGGGDLMYALTSAGRKGGPGAMPNASCWSGNRSCGCYEVSQCVDWLPAAIPAQSSHPVADIRDHGWKGGPGMVRLKFIGS